MFSKSDLSGLDDWDQDMQGESIDFVAEFDHLFPSDDLDLGKTSVVKQSIKLANQTTSKVEGFLLANMIRSRNIWEKCWKWCWLESPAVFGLV